MLRYRGDEVEGQTVGPNGVNDDDHLWISTHTHIKVPTLQEEPFPLI